MEMHKDKVNIYWLQKIVTQKRVRRTITFLGNKNAKIAIEDAMTRDLRLKVTVPYDVDE